MPRIRAENIEAHKELTRRQILETASELFLAQGYSTTLLGDIAAAIGIGRTTLYDYFPDKESILVELVEESIPQLVADMIAAVPQTLSCRERLGELVHRNLAFIADETNLGTLIMREVPKLSPDAQKRVQAAHTQLEDEIGKICREGVASGEFRRVDPAWAGKLVSSTMMGAARVLLQEPDPKQLVHTVADEMIELLFAGLAA